MDPITIGMLAMGVINAIDGQSKEDRQTKLAASTQRYSPWTHLQAQPITYANPVGDLAQAGASALSYNQGLKKEAAQKTLMDSQNELMKAQIAALNRGGSGSTSPMMGGGAGPMSMSGESTSYSPWAAAMNKGSYGYDYY